MDRSKEISYCTSAILNEDGYESHPLYDMAYMIVHRRARQDFIAKRMFQNTVLYVLGDGHGSYHSVYRDPRTLFLSVLQDYLSILSIRQQNLTVEDVQTCLYAFHEELMERFPDDFGTYGICLSFVWILPERNLVFVFQHGDNFVFLKEKDASQGVKLLSRYDVNHISERDRIGEFHFMGEQQRYNGILAVTRSIGDLQITLQMKSPRNHLFPLPNHLDVSSFLLSHIYFICLASDGINFSPEELLPLLDNLRHRNFATTYEKLETMKVPDPPQDPYDDQAILYIEFHS